MLMLMLMLMMMMQDHVVYSQFNGIVLAEEEGRNIATALGSRKAALLQPRTSHRRPHDRGNRLLVRELGKVLLCAVDG